jgi:hypothetical protein
MFYLFTDAEPASKVVFNKKRQDELKITAQTMFKKSYSFSLYISIYRLHDTAIIGLPIQTHTDISMFQLSHLRALIHPITQHCIS